MLTKEDKKWLVELAETIVWSLGYLINASAMRQDEKEIRKRFDELQEHP